MSLLVRRRFIFKGRVQGVGLRPTIYKLAKKLGLSGIVLNAPNGVIVEVEGDSGQVDKFINTLKSKQPPNARILKIETSPLPPIGYMSFRILPSAQSGERTTFVPPDIGTCKDCEKELFNPRDRRFGYPFINCIHCGPRFSIIKDIPYDREKTTMSKFHMCSLCEYEYSDPSNRRFHAEPNACDDCGPHLFLVDKFGKRVETLDPILKVVQLIKEGKIIALKSLGGFQILCDATNRPAVLELRKRKSAPHKPFAVMSYSLKEIKSFAKVSDKEADLLASNARPIVLLKKRKAALLAEEISQISPFIGVMLPQTPIHFLILKENFLALALMSAAGITGPIIKDDDAAVSKLNDIADFIMVHDKKIANRCEDSIARVVKNKILINKRGTGYAPDPIKISNESFPPILGCGSLKDSSFTITRGKRAYPSQYIGKLDNQETFDFYKDAIHCYENLFKVKPKIIAHDANDEYASTKYAKSMHNGARLIPVSHLEAHISSVMAEHNIHTNVIGVVFDGASDFFVGRPGFFERKAHLKYLDIASDDEFLRQLYKSAFAYLYDAYGEDMYKLKLDSLKKYKNELKLFQNLQKSNMQTSGTSFFFDAVAFLLGIRDHATYDRQTILELEAIAQGKGYKSYDFEIDQNLVLNPALITKGIVEDIMSAVPSENISYKFHNTLGKAIGKICKILSKETKLKRVCLSGDAFENSFLLEAAFRELKKVRLEVYVNEKLPVNDQCISLGQVRFAKDVML